MKKFALFLLFLLPFATFGQLFPKVYDFRGPIRNVTEKKYGRDKSAFFFFKSYFHPSAFSGWKYIYDFDENTKLIKRTETFRNEIKAEYIYQRQTDGNRRIVRQITGNKADGHDGDYLEYENFLNADGKIEKTNYWAYDSKEGTLELFLVEQNAQYAGDRLQSFIRQLVNQAGDTESNENCKLFYNNSGELIRLERTDIVSGFQTVIHYDYDSRRLPYHFSVDLMTELPATDSKQLQDIYYDFDSQGNWTRMYRKVGDNNQMEAKRKIRYQ